MARICSIAAIVMLWVAPAAATEVLDVLQGSDGNFSFSVVHSSTGGNDGQSGTILDSITLGDSGGSTTVNGSLYEVSVELIIAGSTYDASGVFDLAGLLDDTAQLDQLLGTLTLTYVSGTNTDYDGLTFFFEDRNYSTATSPPNSLDGDVLSLWGATAYDATGVPAIGDYIDLTTGGTGIDLRLQLAAPIPEPGALLAFVTGFLVIEVSRRQKSSRRA